MDMSFINYLLLFSLVLILALYLYQNMPKSSNGNFNNKSNKTDKFMPVIWDTCPIGRKTGMPVHKVGPVYNFHQRFNKYSQQIQNQDALPTGIPEMGWRNYYLAHYNNNNELQNEDPFSGTCVRNFLDNMENVDNLYRKCL